MSFFVAVEASHIEQILASPSRVVSNNRRIETEIFSFLLLILTSLFFFFCLQAVLSEALLLSWYQ